MPAPPDDTLSPSPRPADRALLPRPHLFVVLSSDAPRGGSSRHALVDVDEVVLGRGEPSFLRSEEAGTRRLTIKLADRWMSSTHARISRQGGRFAIEDAGSRNGTLVNGAVTNRALLVDGDVIEAGHTFLLFRDALETAVYDPDDLDSGGVAAAATGLSTLLPPLSREFERIIAAARSREEVVLFGESGTGKEVVARAIHVLSGRPGAFVAVNCGAIPEGLVESELFGHRRGAFTDAREDRLGLVRAAETGTLFLDEIGDLPVPSQAKFLRVLQEREVVPLGATRPVPVDVRLVAATHQDLARRVAEGRFRADLFARIAGFTITLPPLRHRREDFGMIVAELIRHVEGSEDVTFTIDAVRALLAYRWPLNIRELEKSVRTAAVLARSRGAAVDVEDLPREVQAALALPLGGDPDTLPGRPLDETDQARRDQLIAILRASGGNVSEAARRLGKARMQVQRWLRRYGIDAEAFRPRG